MAIAMARLGAGAGLGVGVGLAAGKRGRRRRYACLVAMLLLLGVGGTALFSQSPWGVDRAEEQSSRGSEMVRGMGLGQSLRYALRVPDEGDVPGRSGAAGAAGASGEQAGWIGSRVGGNSDGDGDGYTDGDDHDHDHGTRTREADAAAYGELEVVIYEEDIHDGEYASIT